MNNKNENSLNQLIETPIIIAVVIILIGILILVSPLLLIGYLIYSVNSKIKKYRFLKNNSGKVILCLTNGNRMKGLVSNNTVIATLVDDVLPINIDSYNNTYENYNLTELINKEKGFPQLIVISDKGVITEELKKDYKNLGKGIIKLKELISIIENKTRTLKEQL